MQIKTVWKEISNTKAFDEEVNAALADGYVLTKREHHWAQTLTEDAWEGPSIYAELVLPDAQPEPEPITDPVEAMRIVVEECDGSRTCEECRLHDICKHRPPSLWEEIPE